VERNGDSTEITAESHAWTIGTYRGAP